MTTIIFDMDGTLLDTLEDLTDAVNYALEKHGFEGHSIEAVRNMVGNGVRKLVVNATPEGESNPLFEDIFASFLAYYKEHSLDKTKPYAGTQELADELHRRGHKIAIVSNKIDEATKSLAAQFFPGSVDIALGDQPGLARKPAPDMVLKAMELLDADPANTVYIGDSEVDLATARNSGLPCISVLWGFRSQEFLLQQGATTFVSIPSEILQLV